MLIPLGTHEGIMSYPDEQIGYLASEQYSSRIASPAHGGPTLHKLHSNSSQPHIESPLRKASFPADVFEKAEFDKSRESLSGRSDAIDSEAEEEVIHVDDPDRKYHKVIGGEEHMHETEDLGPHGGNTPDHGGYIDENGYGVPILASDEVAKDVGAEHMQPAVSPKQERRSSAYYIGDEYGSGNITPTSRPSSRPGSIHGVHTSLARFSSRHEEREEMHTPLEDVEEYEPLFPDEDKNKQGPVSAAERFKARPDMLKHRFPSQDIWEDTPSSAMHVTTVSTPDLLTQNDSTRGKPASKTFEDPSVEMARKGEVNETEKAKLLPKEERLAKSRFAPHLRDDMGGRPGMQQRFPSRDIWEDTPDSMQLVTTVASSPPPGEEAKSPEEATPNKPSIPPRPLNRGKLGESSTTPNVPVSTEVKQPQIPARPPKRMHAVPPADAQLTDAKIPPSQNLDKNMSPTEGRKGPSLPDRPKPQVPARPAKKESLEALTKTQSAGSSGSQDTVTSPPLPKAKPSIPPRAGGTKAHLPTGFMSDLNQRLQLGPRPPVKEKEPEPEPIADKEVGPLTDARKGRARGPQRRAPAKSPASSTDTATPSLPIFSLSTPRSLWSITEDDGLVVNTAKTPQALPEVSAATTSIEDTDSKANAASSSRPTDAPKTLAPTGLALNIAGGSTDPSPLVSDATATPGTEKSDPLNKSIGSLIPESKDKEDGPSGSSSLPKQTTAGSGDDASGVALERDGDGTSEPPPTTTAAGEEVSEAVLAADMGKEPVSKGEVGMAGDVGAGGVEKEERN